MNRYLRRFLIITFLSFFIFISLEPVVAENSDIVIEFFISSKPCDSCDEKKPIVETIEELYGENITIDLYLVHKNDYEENYNRFINYGFKIVPAIAVRNLTAKDFDVLLLYEDITEENLIDAIEYHFDGNYTTSPPEKEQDELCISTPFGEVCINLTDASLPIITVLLGAIDSVNPCSFFVLLFLLSLLLYTKSRKRMIFVGGIFIFFSGFIYFLLMAAILNFISVVENQYIISYIAGIIAIVFGALNIKDFFYFKKGPSTSISDKQKSKLAKQMRKIIKITSVPSLFISTVVLAISANTVELLCSFYLPFIYTGTILPLYNLGVVEKYMYLVFYNVVYVIPLLIIVTLMVVTLGRWKLTEFQGRILKLFSGIMILSLGIILLVKYEILNDVFSIIYILLLSLVSSLIISVIWKKKFEIREN
jgi:cytochrome c biogenesis protein CcdA